jgi:murein DD-endopeptidase MepM/ murein hydrolase activator NlpD
LLFRSAERAGGPAPVYIGDGRKGQAARQVQWASSATVQPGDTVQSIALRHDVSVKALVDANKLQAPYKLTAGQKLTMPPPRTDIAQRATYGQGGGVDVPPVEAAPRSSVESVPLAPIGGASEAAPTPITKQVTTTRPELASADVARAEPMSAEPARTDPSTNQSVPGRGESFLKPPPGAKSGTSARRADMASAEPATLSVPATAGGRHAKAVPSIENAAAPGTPATKAALTQPPPRSGQTFLWPIAGGKVISDYGAKNGGLHNDGINIAAPKGATVRAAENGVVAYAGNELRGFGNLVLVRHADNYVTAYAHTDKVLVKRGDKVRRGQAIAEVGDSGSVDKPQLHFEIRRGSQALDPRKLLSGDNRVALN